MDAGRQNAMPVAGEGEIVKRIRKGTKSCVECRQRKIRCIWTSPHDVVCANCRTRGRDCVPQLYRRTTNAPKLSAKERISRLEQQIANLTSASSPGTKEAARPTSSDLSPRQESSGEDEDVSSEGDIDQEFTTDGPTADGPVHLQFLFDSGRVNERDEENETHLSQARCSRRYLDQARVKLHRLMPSREDVLGIANYAAPWMAIYLALFPSTSSIITRDDMLSEFEAVTKPDAHPVSIAMFLLVFTVTTLQTPQEAMGTIMGKDKFAFARAIAHTVETTIISHTGLAITVEGIEVTVMFLRLKLSLGGVRGLWLSLRRTIALAELIGLPRAWHLKDRAEANQVHSPASTTSSTRDRITQKAGLWQAICATDRLASLMFNLPAATAAHKFPQKKIISPEGHILPREYMFELATVALTVQELDEAYALQQATDEVYEKVLAADRRLRTFANSIPKTWWSDYDTPFSADHLTRFWHHYMTLRIHLPWALKEDGDEYAYSRMVCTKACEHTCRRYCQVRRALPSNFFIYRIIDMQVFTAAVFLILSDIKQQQQQVTDCTKNQQMHIDLVQPVLDTWKLFEIPETITAPFLKEAVHATESLVNILRNPTATSTVNNLSLRIPLLGRVHFGRREPKDQSSRPQNMTSMPTHSISMAPPNISSNDMCVVNPGPIHPPMDNQMLDTAMSNTMPWLMQLDMNSSSLQDPFFVGEDFGGFDMWHGMEGVNMDFGGGGAMQ